MQVHVNVETGARSAITGKSLGGTKHTLSVHGQAMTVLGLKFQLESLNDVDIPPEQQQLYSAENNWLPQMLPMLWRLVVAKLDGRKITRGRGEGGTLRVECQELVVVL